MKKLSTKCSVLLGNLTEKVYRLLDVRLSIFSKNTVINKCLSGAAYLLFTCAYLKKGYKE